MGDLAAAQRRTLDELDTRWDVARFGEAHAPHEVEAIACPEALMTESDVRVEDMPIKFPGTDFRIPEAVAGDFGEIIDQLSAIEQRLNPRVDELFIYLTIDQQQVAAGRSHRPPGVHVDGFQKPSIEPQIIQHQLAVANVAPTIFYVHAFDADRLRVPKKAFFAEVARQADASRTHCPPPGVIHLLNPYCVHAPGVPTASGRRTFVRFSISAIPFMGQDNTRNPLFDYEWDEAAKAAFYASITK